MFIRLGGFRQPDFEHLQIPGMDGQSQLVTVLKVSEKTLLFDLNHPLAGKELSIEIQVLEVL